MRGATAAIEGLLNKIAEEPALREQLRLWAGFATTPTSPRVDDEQVPGELDELLPRLPGRGAGGTSGSVAVELEEQHASEPMIAV